jgi:FkbM family methyltransferase
MPYSEFLERYSKGLQGVYAALRDDLSREIFNNKLQFFLTNDREFLYRAVRATEKPRNARRKTLEDLIYTATVLDFVVPEWMAYPGEALNLSTKKFVVYGAGDYGVRIPPLLRFLRLEPQCFCDSNSEKWGTELDGLPVISPEELLEKHKQEQLYISPTLYCNEIYEDLQRRGFPMENVYVPGNFGKQYFGEPFLRPVEDEIYVDVGVYDGETLNEFIRFCGGAYKKIYGMEPDAKNIRRAQALAERKGLRATLAQKGAWSSRTTLYFESAKDSSKITDSGDISIDTMTIDELVGGDAVTLIKMDIEGSELEALKGAAETISKRKPRLAVSVYHKTEDILTIPVYIKSLVPEYGFYLRHYSAYPRWDETVLYAIAEKEELCAF